MLQLKHLYRCIGCYLIKVLFASTPFDTSNIGQAIILHKFSPHPIDTLK